MEKKIKRTLKCGNCGYDIKRNDRVNYDLKIHQTGKEKISRLLASGTMWYVPYVYFKVSVQCPKCEAWRDL